MSEIGARCAAGVVDRGLRQIPAAVLGRQAFSDLERWLSSSLSQQMALPALEHETELRGRELLRLQLQAHLDGRGTGDLGALVRVNGVDTLPVEYRHKRLHVRSLITLFGKVTIRRMAYSRPGHRSIHPLDAELQLPGRLYSYEVQRRLVKAAVQGPFAEAVGILTDMTGVGIPKRTAEQIVLDASADFESFYDRPRDTCLEAGPILVAAIDSKGIPVVKLEEVTRSVRQRKGEKRQKKRMSTVAAVYTQRPEQRTADEVVQRLFTPAHLTRHGPSG